MWHKMKTEQAPKSLIKTHTALVRYPRFNELHDDIRMCQEMSKMAGEPQCMVLEGVTGAGKSTLVQTYAEVFPRYETDSGTKIPMFYMETPSPVTVKGLAARMLEELGDPAAHKGTLWSMNSRLRHFIRECWVQLVILDDFHHLIDRETNHILEKVSDWLKVLIKDTNVPFLVVGIEGRVEIILQTNSQLSRLFAARETLLPFRWDPSDEKTIKEFAAFVQYAEMGIGIPLSQELQQEEFLHRLHYATSGVVGNVMNLMRASALQARMQKSESLTLSILSQAFDKRLRKHLAGRVNPFDVDADQRFVAPPLAPAADVPNSVGNRSKRRKKRQPTAADVLKTR
jgi:energy-coupling factor transporter ATP-binding protein EcfA2